MSFAVILVAICLCVLFIVPFFHSSTVPNYQSNNKITMISGRFYRATDKTGIQFPMIGCVNDGTALPPYYQFGEC
jgi:hypothetical protein